MTSLHHAHHRTSPPNVKKTAVRAQRPTPLTRSASSRSVAKATKAKKHADVSLDDEVQDDGMATSFLQFCAMCEKQIIVPNNSILYCSESCRRKDCSPPHTCNPYMATMSPTLSPYPTFGTDLTDPLGPKVKELIPRLQPTVLPPPTATSAQIPTLAPTFPSDLDPTEWKPKLQSRHSDAFQYLSLFHPDDPPAPTRRPVLPSRSRTLASSTTTPSLSHTPSSASSRDASPVGTPYEFVTRPLPPRHDVAAAPKSVQLVTPLVTPHPYAFGAPTLPAHDVGGGKGGRSAGLGEAKKGPEAGAGGLRELIRGADKGTG